MFASLYLSPLPGRAADARAQLMTVAQEFSPRIERLCDDLVVLDVSGLGRWFENLRALGEALRRAAADRGLAAHVAVAATRTAAVLCARGRAGLTVAPPGQEAAWLASLPLNVLSAWTSIIECSRSFRSRKPTDPDAAVPIDTLKRWGLKTLGDLASLPSVELSERLGQAGIVWQRLARGEDLQPLVPALPDEHYEESLKLEWPIDQLEPLSFVLGRLLETLCGRLEHADRGVAILRVRLDLVGGGRFVRALQLPAPMRDARTLRTLALLNLESTPPPEAIDRVTVAADVVEGRVLQFSLLQRALSAERLSTLLARLSALMGSDRIGAPALVDTYRPGAFAMTPFTAGSPQPAARRKSLNAEVAEFLKINSSAPSATSVSSALIDLPAASRRLPAAIVRRFRQPIPARVDVHQSRPVRVTSNRRHLRGGSVEACAGPWRSSGNWWVTDIRPRESTLERPVLSERGQSREFAISEKWFPASPKAWDRDEWEVALRDGATYVIFQDRHRGCWFIDGILD